MARVHGKDLSTLTMDDSGGTSRDVLAETTSLDFKVSAEMHNTETFGDDWKEVTSGLKGGDTFDQELFYNNAATASGGTWLLATGRLGVEGTLAFGDGTRSVSMETVVTAVSLPISVGDMMKVKVTHQITGAVTFS